MKTTSVKRIMAVVLSLSMLLGSAGVVEAKDTGRYLNVNFTDAYWDLSGGINFVLPSASFSYNNLQFSGTNINGTPDRLDMMFRGKPGETK